MSKEKRSQLYQLFVGFWGYFFVGGVGALVDWFLFWVLDGKLQWNYYAATAVSFTACFFVNWALGRATIYRKRAHKGDLFQTAVVSFSGLALNMLLMNLFIEQLHLPHMAARIAATGVAFFYNFVLRYFWVYRDRGEEKK